jgi:hypothetical protein
VAVKISKPFHLHENAMLTLHIELKFLCALYDVLHLESVICFGMFTYSLRSLTGHMSIHVPLMKEDEESLI